MLFPFLLAFKIGVIAGLRSLTAPAAVCFGAQMGWIDLRQSPLAFMGSNIACWIFGLLAVGELIMDKLPFTPSRLAPTGLFTRIVMGGLSGAAFCAARDQSMVSCVMLGVFGGLAGAFLGYHVRQYVVSRLRVPGLVAALLEDAIAIGGAVLLVSRS